MLRVRIFGSQRPDWSYKKGRLDKWDTQILWSQVRWLVSQRTAAVQSLSEAGSWGRAPFGNLEKGDRPPLEAATKQRLVKTWLWTLACVTVISKVQSRVVLKKLNKSDLRSLTRNELVKANWEDFECNGVHRVQRAGWLDRFYRRKLPAKALGHLPSKMGRVVVTAIICCLLLSFIITQLYLPL
jgi:hypothetical protein